MANPIAVHELSHRIGTDGTWSYTIRDADGDVVDISAATLTMSVRDYPGGTEQFDADDLTDSLAGTAAGVISIDVTESELTSEVPGQYALTFGVTIGTTTTIYPLDGPLVLRLLPRGD